MSTDAFRFVSYQVRVHAGPDAISKLVDEADRLKSKRVLVVCGQSVLSKTDLIDRVKAALGDRVAGLFSGGQTGSPVTSILDGVAMAREIAADGIVSVGGGSCKDVEYGNLGSHQPGTHGRSSLRILRAEFLGCSLLR